MLRVTVTHTFFSAPLNSALILNVNLKILAIWPTLISAMVRLVGGV